MPLPKLKIVDGYEAERIRPSGLTFQRRLMTPKNTHEAICSCDGTARAVLACLELTGKFEETDETGTKLSAKGAEQIRPTFLETEPPEPGFFPTQHLQNMEVLLNERRRCAQVGLVRISKAMKKEQ